MENLIKFYEFNEQKLLDYDKETINKLYDIIINAKNNLNNDIWEKTAKTIIKECDNTFSISNNNYIDSLDNYIPIVKDLLVNNNSIKIENQYIIKKLNLYEQMLEYLKILNYSENVFFDKEKYEITINTYNIFFNLQKSITESIIEWHSNNYVFFYSKSNNNTNICIYGIDDLYGYKLFLTFRKENISNKIKIVLCDVIINSNNDFYKKIKIIENWKIQESSDKINNVHLINIEQIAECFSNDNIKKEFCESNYVDVSKMLEYVGDFLDN